MTESIDTALDTAASMPTEAAAVAAIALAGTEPIEVEPGDYYVFRTPDGITTVDRRGDVPWAERRRGDVQVGSIEALRAYCERYGTKERLQVWVPTTKPTSVDAVLNAHTSGPAEDAQPHNAGRGDWRARFTLEPTEDWKAWMANDGRLLDQEAFAEFIEDQLHTIVSPDGATLLEVAQTFHATTQVQVRAARRLQSGAISVQWEEDTAARGGRDGGLEVPTEFVLAVEPFPGEPAVQLLARLRYRVARGGDLSLGYRINRPDDAMREALNTIAANVAVWAGEQVHRSA